MEIIAEKMAKTGQSDPSIIASTKVNFLQKTMLDASPDCIKLLKPDGTILTMNRAGCIALNVPMDTQFGMEWLPLLPPDIFDAGSKALAEAKAGRTARFAGRSENEHGISYWDNLLTPIWNADNMLDAILCVSRDVTEKVVLEKALEEAMGREKLLSGELQHRIKNMFSVVIALSYIADKEAARSTTETASMEILREKLYALSRAVEAIFIRAKQDGEPQAQTVSIADLMAAVLAPYLNQCAIEGRDFHIPTEISTTLALFLHEHATNSVKYGAMSADGGMVQVGWSATDKHLHIDWVETGGPEIIGPPSRSGFGSEMVRRIVQSTGGEVRRDWLREGLHSKLSLPLGSPDRAA